MKNKIFKVSWDGETDTIFAIDEKGAIEHCIEYNNLEETDIEGCEEVPESEWDKKCGIIYPENDTEQEPYDVTYRDLYFVIGPAEIMVSTNMDWL